MWNVLLDKLPDNFEGFKINSDFRIGIQLQQILENDTFSGYEKFFLSYRLLFMRFDEELDDYVPFLDENGNEEELPDVETAQKGITWFLSGWYTDKALNDNPEKTNKKVMDYDIDQWRIYSAFRLQHSIDLNEDDVHFWKFMGLLTNLEECAFTRVVDLRTKEIDPKMSPSTKKELREAKERYSLEEVTKAELSEQEQKEYDIFMSYVKKPNRQGK